MDNGIKYRAERACGLLKSMIEIPSCTFEEQQVADFLYEWLLQISEKPDKEEVEIGKNINGFKVLRIANNIVAIPHNYNQAWPTLMLNAHIDTVKPSESYTNNPFEAIAKDGAIYGLGSNDDGGSVVSLIETFLHFAERGADCCKEGKLVEEIQRGCCNRDSKTDKINIILVLSAEEERSGANGISLVLKELPQLGIKVDFAIIGEPTGMKAAIAERGLLVLDGTAEGVSGHAARNEGVNAIYKAIEDINALRNYKFAKQSPLMGDVKLTVTQINAGSAHNVVPDRCTFVVDIRPTEQYTNSEILELLQKEVGSTLVARNLKNRSSATPQDHLQMKALKECGIETFISPTTSDWMRLGEIPAIKIGPGDSARSHKADEYILKEEIANGIDTYIMLINSIISQANHRI